MSKSLKSYLEAATPRACEDLVAAFLRIPEDKRDWSPMGDARTAFDQMAEVAILNGRTADLAVSRVFEGDMAQFPLDKAALVAKDWEAIEAQLKEGTAHYLEVLRNLPESDYSVEIAMPWGPMTIEQILGYPFWNMCYHEGQINYIASMLRCLG